MLSEDLEKTYNLVFERKIKDGCDVVVVKKSLEQFFNNNPELVKQLFSKEKTVLKRKLSKEIAEKYKSAIEGTGALCRIAENTKTIPVEGVPTASIPKKIHDLETVTRFLLKVTNLNQKVMWFTLVLSLLSLILWISFFFDVIGSSSTSEQGNSNSFLFANDWDKLSIKGTVHRSVNDSGDLFVKSAGDDPRINFPLLSFKANTRYLIDIQMTSSVESRLQIYYTESTQKTRALSEKNSLRFPVKKGENTVHAFIGVNNLGRVMRLDPIKTAGEVTIKRLKIIALD